MPDLVLKLSEELEGKTKEEKLAVFDKEIDRFSKWIERLSDSRANGPLSNPEKALIKTYLVQKYTGKLDE